MSNLHLVPSISPRHSVLAWPCDTVGQDVGAGRMRRVPALVAYAGIARS